MCKKLCSLHVRVCPHLNDKMGLFSDRRFTTNPLIFGILQLYLLEAISGNKVMWEIQKFKLIHPTGIIVGLVFLFFFNVLSAHAFRCGTRLISVGDPKVRVLAECGDPTHIEIWEEERIFRDYHAPKYLDPENRHSREYFLVRQYVTIEKWTYNLGVMRFIRHLTFENGSLIRITTGKHGY